MNKRCLNHPLRIFVFLICTSAVAHADKGALVGSPADDGCEAILEAAPLASLIADIAENLDSEVIHQIQIRASGRDRIRLADLRRVAQEYDVEIEAINVMTERGMSIVDLQIRGTGRRVIQTLVELPRFRNGIHWMRHAPASAAITTVERPSASALSRVPTVPISQIYSKAEVRTRTITSALRRDLAGPVVLITSYGRPAFVMVQKNFHLEVDTNAFIASLRRLDLGVSDEGWERRLIHWRSESLEPVDELALNPSQGVKIFRQAAENCLPFELIPDAQKSEASPRTLVVYPIDCTGAPQAWMAL